MIVADDDDLFAISERFEVPMEQIKEANKLPLNDVRGGQKIHVGASQEPSTHKAASKEPLAQMSCEDFVGLDESFQPKAVYWAIAYGKGGKPEAEAVDVQGVETVTPVVVQECQKAPKESFWQKVTAEWEKMKAKL